MMTNTREIKTAALPCVAALLLGAVASAQPARTPPALQRTEQGVGDVEALGITLRDMQVDLRRPTGFDGVFRLDRANAFGPQDTVFMRMDGGVTAVFPRSVYVPTGEGLVPTIPPGTIFYIGDLPAELRPRTPIRPPYAANYLDLSINQQAASEPLNLATSSALEALPTDATPPAGGADETPLPDRSIWTDDAYRSRRIASLLRRAAGKEPESPSASPVK